MSFIIQHNLGKLVSELCDWSRIDFKSPTIDVNHCDTDGRSALHFAAEYGHADSVVALLCMGADINCIDNGGRNALHLAVTNNRIKVAALLVDNGVDLAARTKGGQSALLLAAKLEDRTIFAMLLRNDVKDQCKQLGKLVSIVYERVEAMEVIERESRLVRFLKQLVLVVNDSQGYIQPHNHPRIFAAAGEEPAICSKILPLLIEHGVDVFARNEKK